jgi:hypothetical protein
MLSFTPRGGEVGDDVAGVGQGAGEPVEFGDDEGVAVAAGGEGFTEPGTVPIGAGEAVFDVDPWGSDPNAVRASRCAVRS